MKIILTDNVTGLGESGDVVEVKDGYARNYLLPKSLAMVSTRGAERQVADIRRSRRAREIRNRDHALEVQQKLEGKTVQLQMRSGEAGRLFGSVTAEDVAQAVKSTFDVPVDKRQVVLREHIKTLGRHHIVVRLHPEVNCTVLLDVLPAKK